MPCLPALCVCHVPCCSWLAVCHVIACVIGWLCRWLAVCVPGWNRNCAGWLECGIECGDENGGIGIVRHY
jgi:hypothetical protein